MASLILSQGLIEDAPYMGVMRGCLNDWLNNIAKEIA
jgi:hypothetical protein